jgi:hypothetical protein
MLVAHEGVRGLEHRVPQALGDALAQRLEQGRPAHGPAERLRLVGVQAQHLEQEVLDLARRERLAQALVLPPCAENAARGVQSELDAPQPQRLDPVVGNPDARRDAADAREKLAVDLPRGGEDLPRRARRRRLRRALDHQGVLARFLGDVLGEERLERRQREAQRQGRAQLGDGEPAEFAQQPAVQRGECPFAVQACGGFTAR